LEAPNFGGPYKKKKSFGACLEREKEKKDPPAASSSGSKTKPPKGKGRARKIEKKGGVQSLRKYPLSKQKEGEEGVPSAG